MTPNFASAVDPIFLAVLDLLDRIRGNQPLEPATERESLQNRFREAEAQLGTSRSWEIAKYGLTGWIDDVMISAPWDGRSWWENNSLEFAFFKTRDRATEFFVRAQQAAELPKRDALEVFYVCVVLGFRGLYGLSEAVFLADQLKIPPNVEDWAKRTARSIQLGQGRPAFDGGEHPGLGAPALEGKFQLVGAALMAVVLSSFAIVLGYFLFLS